jgi:hypothetical protein
MARGAQELKTPAALAICSLEADAILGPTWIVSTLSVLMVTVALE